MPLKSIAFMVVVFAAQTAIAQGSITSEMDDINAGIRARAAAAKGKPPERIQIPTASSDPTASSARISGATGGVRNSDIIAAQLKAIDARIAGLRGSTNVNDLIVARNLATDSAALNRQLAVFGQIEQTLAQNGDESGSLAGLRNTNTIAAELHAVNARIAGLRGGTGMNDLIVARSLAGDRDALTRQLAVFGQHEIDQARANKRSGQPASR